MAKNLLGESTVRQFMKLANLERHADDVVAKHGLLNENLEGDDMSEPDEGEEKEETGDDAEEDKGDAFPETPEESEVELDTEEPAEGGEMDVAMSGLKDAIRSALEELLPQVLQDLASSGQLSVENEPGAEMGQEPGMDMGGDMGLPGDEMSQDPGMDVGAEPPMPGGDEMAPEMGAEEEPPMPPLKEDQKAGLASKGQEGKGTFTAKGAATGGADAALAAKGKVGTGTFSKAKQGGDVKKAEDADLASKGTVMEEGEVEEGMDPKAFADAAKKGKVGQEYAKARNLKKVGKTPEESAAFKQKIGVKSKPVAESRKAMMEAYIARYGKAQLVQEVSKRIAKRLDSEKAKQSK